MDKVRYREGERRLSTRPFRLNGNVRILRGITSEVTCQNGLHIGGRNGRICQMQACPTYNDPTQLVYLPKLPPTLPARQVLAMTNRSRVQHTSSYLKIAQHPHELRRICLHHLAALQPLRSQILRKLSRPRMVLMTLLLAVNDLAHSIQLSVARRRTSVQVQVYKDLQQQQLHTIATPGLDPETMTHYGRMATTFGLHPQALRSDIPGQQVWLQSQQHHQNRARTTRKRLRSRRPSTCPILHLIAQSNSPK